MNSTKEILILQPIPRLACGVTDHTNKLIFDFGVLGVRAYRIAIKNLADLSDKDLKNKKLLIQISIYGYDKRGIPFELVEQIKRAKKNGAKIIGYFHETWVPSALWKSSAYWLRPIQKKICRDIVCCLDAAFFNSAWAQDWGESVIGELAQYSPTFSNVGDLDELISLGDRPARLVCFGSPSARKKAYLTISENIDLIKKSEAISEILDIGSDESVIENFKCIKNNFDVEVFGMAHANDVSNALAFARYSTHYTPWSLATKSGVYAAAVAHGAIPVSIDDVDTLPLSSAIRLRERGVICIGFKSLLEKIIKNKKYFIEEYSSKIESARDNYVSSRLLAKKILENFNENNRKTI